MSSTLSGGAHILWIEEQINEYDLLDDLRQASGTEGRVDVALTVARGYELLVSAHYDLVLLDLMLPWTEEEFSVGLVQLTGGEWLLQQLRSSQDWETAPNCYVIVLTARGNQETLERVRGILGSSGQVLNKPLPVEAIMEHVQSALKQAR